MKFWSSMAYPAADYVGLRGRPGARKGIRMRRYLTLVVAMVAPLTVVAVGIAAAAGGNGR